ncbi:MAG: DUF389 domain-containing protein [bacterium]
MIHLRVVADGERADEAFRFLEGSASVISLVRLPGAARKPNGDLILFDVAREDCTRIITELRRQGIHHHGTIALDYVDTAISDAARAAEDAAPGAVGDAVVWETVRARAFEEADPSFAFVAFMALATMIGAIGILTDSVVLIIGAMILGPEFGPLAGISVATVERRWRLVGRSVRALAVGFPAGITAAFVLTLVLEWTGVGPDAMPTSRQATFFISHPDWYSLVVAIAAGIAGTLSLTTVRAGTLIGVLVSVTTIPAAANIAVAAVYRDWSEWRGSMLQLSVNLLAMIAAGVVTLAVELWAYHRRSMVLEAGWQFRD